MIRVIALCMLALPALAQQNGPLSLGGVAINTKTGEPLPRALVTIMRYGDAEPTVKLWKAFTDSRGRFHFSDLPAGRYSLSAEKPEFTFERATPDDFTVNLTTPTESMRLKLAPLGVITGRIVDQDGLPVLGVNVSLFSTQIQDGRVQIKPERNTERNGTTDDRGVYRLWNLRPGKYYVKVAGSGSGTLLTAANANAGLGDESFAAVYFGGGRTLDSAKPVEIGPGSESHADFRLSIEPAFKICGTIVNFAQRRTVKFELLSGSDEVSTVGAAVNNDTGRFELAAVVGGSYVLRATQDGNTAEMPVTVRAADVDGVSLTLMPPVDIRVVTHSPGNQPAVIQDGDVFRAQPNCVVQLGSAGRLNTFSADNNAGGGSGDRDFVRGVPPGRYRVSFRCFGAYVRSATAGTHDLAADPIIAVEPGVSPPPIDVAVSPGGGIIRGTVAFDGATANVLVVPQFSSVAGPQMISAQRFGAGNKLQFQASYLAPGSYLVYAFARQDIEFRNPEFLRALSGGVAVQVDGDGAKKITIDGVVP